MATFEQEVLKLTNDERAKFGLPALKGNTELNYAADGYAELMAEKKFFSHVGPDGSRAWDRAKKVGFEAQTMGENIAFGQRTPKDVVQAWMDSPGHRANILNRNFTELGVGFEQNYWVQKFGSKDLNPTTNIPNSSSGSGSQPTPPSNPTPTPNPIPTPPPVNNNGTFEQRVLELTNIERSKQGLAPLKANKELNYAADKYAELMSDKNYFNHTGPDGTSPWDRMKAVGFQAQVMGENIAVGQQTPEQVVKAWMNSPGHRANILNGKFTQLGVGEDDKYWVQNFGSDDLDPTSKIPNSPSNAGTQPTPAPQAGKEFKGGDGNDVLTGDSGNNVLWGRKGNDTLNGGGGSDRLIGGIGIDKLTGGTGKDTFVYKSLQDKGDTITDFSSSQDKIDLRQIMAGSAYQSKNQFSDFLKLQQVGSDTVVKLDMDGNKKAGGFDKFILLEKVNASSLNASNFLV
ncbi:CAP domain-containing protein [Tolypothrix sp. FACHB-123]|uniref:CAP domain-containing protein n=1 Tax=Tolypothrix sp. FACHB-123 TaxID=2692868 RepID=UPI0027D2998D|nr:CAP domain-containing protein [Tolypothrix sp. FACHB-123]